MAGAPASGRGAVADCRRAAADGGLDLDEARAAITGLNGKDFNGNRLKVNFEFSKARCRRR